MSTQRIAVGRAPRESYVARLAKFFSAACPVRIPVRVTRTNAAQTVSENTIIEFGTPREVLFACRHPLEFGDKLRLENSDGTLDVEASVVAVQYHDGQTAIAARFTEEVTNWIVKP